MTNEEYIRRARKEYQRDGEIEVDDNAVVSRGSDPGAYVQAWVWVYNDTYGTDNEVGSEDEEDQHECAAEAEESEEDDDTESYTADPVS
jgi:hypothetical protein